MLGADSNVEVSNITFVGDERCAGLFSSLEPGPLGFNEGVILGTGTAKSAAGPNNSDETTTEFFTPGDDFLNSLLDNEETFDACVLEFDFVCDGADQVSVDYVMGSEEYNEFVAEGVNDVFGFGLNGTNIATIPNSGGLPVSIGNLNCGDPYNPNAPTTPNVPFCDLFKNNDIQDGGPTFDIEADGFTQVLTAESALEPGVNRFKFAVGDTIDQAFDTWVFIRSGSFQCNVPDVIEKKVTLLSTKKSFQDSNGVQFENEDIVSYDAETQEISPYFDGSDVGLRYANVDAFAARPSGDIVLSVGRDKYLEGLGKVKAEDIIRFVPSMLGDDTQGTFEVFFDAERNGLVCEVKKEEPCECKCDCHSCDYGDKHYKSNKNYDDNIDRCKAECPCVCDSVGKLKYTENNYNDNQNECLSDNNSGDISKKTELDFLANKSENWNDEEPRRNCACNAIDKSKYSNYRVSKGSRNKCPEINIDALDVVEDTLSSQDDDNDGIPNEEDLCPLDAENDSDMDGLCGNVKIYFSLAKSFEIGGIRYEDEDIIEYDESTGIYTMIFDGSDVGLHKSDIDTLKLLDNGNILISFKSSTILDGLGEIGDEDVVVFEPSALGEETSGIFVSLDVDGSTLGAMSCKEFDVDGVDQLLIVE